MLQAALHLADAIGEAAQGISKAHHKASHQIRDGLNRITHTDVQTAAKFDKFGPAAHTNQRLAGGDDHSRSATPFQRPTSPAVKGPIGHMSAEEVEELLKDLGPPAEWPKRVEADLRIFQKVEEIRGAKVNEDWLPLLRRRLEEGPTENPEDDDVMIDFYHGTNKAAEGYIRTGGVDTRYPRHFCDAGQGFYTSDDPLFVKMVASRHPNPAVLHYKIKLGDLAKLKVKILDPESPELLDFALPRMFNDPETPFDVVILPNIVNRGAVAFENAVPIYAGRQVVFCNDTGGMLDAGLQPAPAGHTSLAESAMSTTPREEPGDAHVSSVPALFGEEPSDRISHTGTDPNAPAVSEGLPRSSADSAGQPDS
ncbi:hypothetical protein [Nocardia sp. NBC_00403]|uniref:hypothetical protein n=1 Tax=Nocardia sp. NBC_00403 TaxID=2975990 RepID=UPI002E1ABD09